MSTDLQCTRCGGSVSTTTGWPPGLLQDDCKKLSQWFASRIDARHVVRQVCREIRLEKEMSDKQPEALLIADQCDESAKLWANEVRTRRQAAALLRTQHAAIERKDALLRQALAALDAAASWVLDKEILTSIHKELSQ